MKVSFIILAHESYDCLYPLLNTLLGTGANVYFHYDLKGSSDIGAFDQIEPRTGIFRLAKRCKVMWGEWSIVKSTISSLREIDFNCDDSDYFMLLSGSCFPIKPLEGLQSFLASNPFDYIECVNASERRWVTGGIQNERWEKYHYFNYRFQRKRFEASLFLQRKLGVKRVLPNRLTPYIGSQWWCLRRQTVKTVLDYLDSHPIIEKFFSTTCVPDESLFQTLVGNLIPASERLSQPLTAYSFNSWGIPRVYYDDDYDELILSPLFFARKISYRAQQLRSRLLSLYGGRSNDDAGLVSRCLANQDGFSSLSRLRSLYERSAYTPELGLLAANSFAAFPYHALIISSPSPLIRESFAAWLVGTKKDFVVLEAPVERGEKSLVNSLYNLAFLRPRKTFIISMQDWALAEISAFAKSGSSVRIVILPGTVDGQSSPQDLLSSRLMHFAGIESTFSAGLIEGAIDVSKEYLRGLNSWELRAPCCPLFSAMNIDL